MLFKQKLWWSGVSAKVHKQIIWYNFSETRISKKTSLTCNINLKNYSFESTQTESSAGGTLLYISNNLSYKPHFDLNILKKIK